MSKRRVFIGLAFLFVVVGAVYGGYCYYANNIRGYVWLELSEWVDEPGKEVQSVPSGLKAKARENWRFMNIVDLVKRNRAAKIGYFLPESEDTYFTILVEDSPGKVNFMIEESIEVLDENLPKASEGFEKIRAGKIKLKGLDAYALVYEFSNLSSGIKNVITGERVESKPYTLKKVVFLKGEKMYYVDFAARSHEYRRDVRDFDRILKSLRID